MYVGQPALGPVEPDVPRSVEVDRCRGRNSYDRDVDGVHDLGGLDGFGPVEHTDDEPMFAHDWERRTFRLMVGAIGSLGGRRVI